MAPQIFGVEFTQHLFINEAPDVPCLTSLLIRQEGRHPDPGPDL